jgi:hypothetical protein
VNKYKFGNGEEFMRQFIRKGGVIEGFPYDYYKK